MNKLFISLITTSMLLISTTQAAYAEGIGNWFNNIFNNEESIETEEHDEEAINSGDSIDKEEAPDMEENNEESSPIEIDASSTRL